MAEDRSTSAHHSNEMLLGRLIEKVDRLIKDNETAHAGRADIHEDLEKIRDRLHTMSNEAQTMQVEVRIIKKDVAPLVAFKAKADRWEQRGIGAIALAGMLASAVGAVFATYWGRVTQWLGFG